MMAQKLIDLTKEFTLLDLTLFLSVDPYQILLYEDTNINTPHYQSLRPIRTQPIIEPVPNSSFPKNAHSKCFLD